MAADSPVFEKTCEEIEGRSILDRLAARGTVRICVKAAGFDPAGVDAEQMGVILLKVIPEELATRGVADADRLCEQVATAIEGIVFERRADRASVAAAMIGRFGS